MAYWMHLTPSPIDTILKQESFTLQELLEEDDIVQECKCCNQILLDFLTKNESIELLLKLMTRPELDHPKAKLYSKKAADVLLCEVTVVTKAVMNSPEHLSFLLSFLEQPSIGDPAGDLALAGHFCRMLLQLSNSHPEEMLEALVMHPNLFAQLLSKLSLDSFKEMMSPMLLAQEEDPMHLVTCWLWGNNVVADTLEILRTTDDMSLHCNVSEMLRELAEQRPQVLSDLAQLDHIRVLVSFLENSHNDDKIANVFHVLSGVVAQGKDAVDEFDVSPTSCADSSVAGVIAGAMEIMVRLLQQVPDQEIPMPAGPLRPVLGKMRLRCVEFIALVMRAYKTGAAASCLHSAMITHGVLPCVINLLFDHPWHNILHIHIDDIIQHCLYSTNDELRIALIDQASLHMRLTHSLQSICPENDAEDAKAEDTEHTDVQPSDAPDKTAESVESIENEAESNEVEAAKPRARAPRSSAGNLGCVIGLAQALSEAAENHDCLMSRLRDEADWNGAVLNILQEELRKQTVELGRTEPLLDMACAGGDSSSEDEQHYIHHSSSDEEGDDDPFHSGVQNRITDAFANSDTTFHDDSDAWSTQPINESDWNNNWVASFSTESSTAGTFGSTEISGSNDFSMVEDPWADQAPEEIDSSMDNWGAGPAWEANFGGTETTGEASGPAWNSCFEATTDTVEGAMVEAVCAVDADVPEEVTEEELVEEVTVSEPCNDGFDVPEEESVGDV